MFEKCEGIVIRTIDYGETNKIVTIFTREWGKVAAMARGAKKPSSRLSSVTQIFTYGVYLVQKVAVSEAYIKGNCFQRCAIYAKTFFNSIRLIRC